MKGFGGGGGWETTDTVRIMANRWARRFLFLKK
jgi:hypothetical protein